MAKCRAVAQQERPKVCHCGGGVELAVMRHPSASAPRSMYRCKNEMCGALVSCKPGTDIAAGSLADHATRAARRELHWQITKIVDAGRMTKADCYDWMMSELKLPYSRRGIGWLDAAECKTMIAAIEKMQSRVFLEASKRGIANLRAVLSGCNVDKILVNN